MPLTKVLVFLTILLLFASASVSHSQEVAFEENVPDEILDPLLVSSFSQTYAVSLRINPFYLRGDFDGDGKPDYAVLIEAKKDHSKGIAVFLSSQSKPVVLGAGQRFHLSSGTETNLDFLNTWKVYGKKAVERGVEERSPPKLSGEALLVGKAESASGLIFWDGKQFRWYQQGD